MRRNEYDEMNTTKWSAKKWFPTKLMRRNEYDELVGDEMISDKMIGGQIIYDKMNAAKWSATESSPVLDLRVIALFVPGLFL